MENTEKFFETYCDFVTKVTSDPSLKIEDLKKSLDDIQDNSPIDTPRLLPAALGLGSETGEFVEIVKKMILQGKPADQDNIFHMKRELGDVMWYVAQACMALGVSLEEITDRNIQKLEKRFPEGHFSEFYSENRKSDDR